ncbi:hypothetical protein ACWEFJ_28460 [Actinosynnema sp. NPDC004786]
MWDDRRWYVDNLVFNLGEDEDGCGWAVDDESGWSDSPLDADRPRVIGLGGWVSAPTRQARLRAEKKLSALCLDPYNPNRLWELRCTEETGDLTAMVRRADKPLVVMDQGGYGLRFRLLFEAPDPRLYGPPTTGVVSPPMSSGGLDWVTGLDWAAGLNWGTVVSSGSILLSNPGYADAPVRFILSGSTVPGEDLVNPRITAPEIDGLLVYADTLTTGQTVEIDTNPRKRTVLLGGTADRRARAAGSRWFTVPAQTDLLVSWSADQMPPTSTLTAIWSTTQW